MLNKTTDVTTITDVIKNFPTTTIRFLPSLHAKIYIADDTYAIVTSGNLTDNSLIRNFEYGVLFVDLETVRVIKLDVLQYASLGSLIDRTQLDTFAAVVSELRAMRQAAERSLKNRIRREFERRVRQIDDECSTPVQRVAPLMLFTQTQSCIYPSGPMSTVEINRHQTHPP
jgi:phosphatidylserine/phosphatidylglycerophosphate/cardiolipin synthase-like enzyme